MDAIFSEPFFIEIALAQSLKISKWNEVYERAESRKLKALSWVSIPTSFSSNGYQCMLDEFGEEAPAIYGAWVALVAIAASCTVRGTLTSSRGTPLQITHLSRLSGFPQPVFEKLLEWAARPEISWLVPSNHLENLEKPEENAFQGIAGGSSGEIPVYTTDKTKPDQTLPNTTNEPNQTVVGQSVSRDFDLSWTLQDVDREANRFRKVSCCKIQSQQLGPILAVTLSMGSDGLQFVRDLADTIRTKSDIKNPTKYVQGAYRIFVENLGVKPESIASAITRLQEVDQREAVVK